MGTEEPDDDDDEDEADTVAGEDVAKAKGRGLINRLGDPVRFGSAADTKKLLINKINGTDLNIFFCIFVLSISTIMFSQKFLMISFHL